MNYRRSTMWSVLWVLGLALVLTACRADTAPPVNRATPTSASPTTGRPTIRGTTVPRATPTARPGSATPVPTALTPGEATLLIEQAVGLLLDYDLGRPKSADLYQAAYDGALLFLARGWVADQPHALATHGGRGTDTPAFHTAYLALANLLAPSVNQTLLAHAAIRAAVERTDQCQTTFLEADEFSRRPQRPSGDRIVWRDRDRAAHRGGWRRDHCGLPWLPSGPDRTADRRPLADD